MILIADGGTTKCDWAGVNISEGKVMVSFTTPGLNPAYISTAQLTRIIKESEQLKSLKDKVIGIYFFGAGCGEGLAKKNLDSVLTSFFPMARRIVILSDIAGAVYACTEKAGVVGILGTGSNICYFDGKDLEFRLVSLGYAIMDQGSGSAIGRKLLQSYFFYSMPVYLQKRFEMSFNLDVDHIKKNLYDTPAPSSFLAAYAKFALDHSDDPFIEDVLISCLDEYFELSVNAYKELLLEVPIHFVGSIAFYARDLLKTICDRRGYKLGNVVRKPILELPKRVQMFNVQL